MKKELARVCALAILVASAAPARALTQEEIAHLSRSRPHFDSHRRGAQGGKGHHLFVADRPARLAADHRGLSQEISLHQGRILARPERETRPEDRCGALGQCAAGRRRGRLGDFRTAYRGRGGAAVPILPRPRRSRRNTLTHVAIGRRRGSVSWARPTARAPSSQESSQRPSRPCSTRNCAGALRGASGQTPAARCCSSTICAPPGAMRRPTPISAS